MPATVDNILGASVDQLNHANISDNDRHAAGVIMGLPTTRLPNGDDISFYQSAPRGHRHYNGGLGNIGGQGQDNTPAPATQIGQQQSTAMTNSRVSRGTGRGVPPSNLKLPAETQVGSGISVSRSKKRLRASFMRGTPNTKAAAEEILGDIEDGTRNSATGMVWDAEQEEDTASSSQDVAKMAIALKKSERERKKKNESD